MSVTDHRIPSSPFASALAKVAMASYLLPGLASKWPALRRGLGVEDRLPSSEGFALTFDDGPHRHGTPAVLEILDRKRVPATFFLVGEQVLANPGLAQEILDAGHRIGLHCHRHRNLLRLAPWQVREDIDRAQATIEDSTGISPSLYRPPYGVLNASALRLARGRGWRTLLWSDWGRDWEVRATAHSIAQRVTEHATPGAVLLLHDADDYSAPGSWRRTVQALPLVLERLADAGLQPTAL